MRTLFNILNSKYPKSWCSAKLDKIQATTTQDLDLWHWLKVVSGEGHINEKLYK